MQVSTLNKQEKLSYSMIDEDSVEEFEEDAMQYYREISGINDGQMVYIGVDVSTGMIDRLYHYFYDYIYMNHFDYMLTEVFHLPKNAELTEEQLELISESLDYDDYEAEHAIIEDLSRFYKSNNMCFAVETTYPDSFLVPRTWTTDLSVEVQPLQEVW